MLFSSLLHNDDVIFFTMNILSIFSVLSVGEMRQRLSMSLLLSLFNHKRTRALIYESDPFLFVTYCIQFSYLGAHPDTGSYLSNFSW